MIPQLTSLRDDTLQYTYYYGWPDVESDSMSWLTINLATKPRHPIWNEMLRILHCLNDSINETFSFVCLWTSNFYNFLWTATMFALCSESTRRFTHPVMPHSHSNTVTNTQFDNNNSAILVDIQLLCLKVIVRIGSALHNWLFLLVFRTTWNIKVTEQTVMWNDRNVKHLRTKVPEIWLC